MAKIRVGLLVGIVVLGLSFGILAASPGLLVLIDSESAEAALIEDLGYTPVGSMQALKAGFDPLTYAVGIGRSGHGLADWDWIVDQLATSTALVGFGWDVAEFIESGESTPPTWVPGMISVAFLIDGDPIYYEMEDADELEFFLTYASTFLGPDDFMSDFGFDFPTDIEMIMAMILAEAEPYLAFFNQFMQPEWEYKVVSLTERVIAADAALEQQLNDLGAEGWELVSVDATRFVFKRRSLSVERLLEQILELAQDAAEQFDETIWF